MAQQGNSGSVFMAFVIAEIVNYVARIVYYRRGF